MARNDFAPYNAVTAGAAQLLTFDAPNRTVWDVTLTQACSLQLEPQTTPGQTMRVIMRGAFSYTLAAPAYNTLGPPQCSASLVDVFDITALAGGAYLATPVAMGAAQGGALPAASPLTILAAASVPIGAAGMIAAFPKAESGATYTVAPNDGRVVATRQGLVVGTGASAPMAVTYTITKTAPGFAPVTAQIAVTFTGSVSPPTPGVPTISGAPGQAQVGAAFSFIPSAAGGVAPYTFALSGALPAGLSFSSSTGAITGTPTAAGTAAGLSITVTDSRGASASLAPFSLVVQPAASGNAVTYQGQPVTYQGTAITSH